jgi:hypothetical protein
MLWALRLVTHGSTLGLVHNAAADLGAREGFRSFSHLDIDNVPYITRKRYSWAPPSLKLGMSGAIYYYNTLSGFPHDALHPEFHIPLQITPASQKNLVMYGQLGHEQF